MSLIITSADQHCSSFLPLLCRYSISCTRPFHHTLSFQKTSTVNPHTLFSVNVAGWHILACNHAKYHAMNINNSFCTTHSPPDDGFRLIFFCVSQRIGHRPAKYRAFRARAAGWHTKALLDLMREKKKRSLVFKLMKFLWFNDTDLYRADRYKTAICWNGWRGWFACRARRTEWWRRRRRQFARSLTTRQVGFVPLVHGTVIFIL